MTKSLAEIMAEEDQYDPAKMEIATTAEDQFEDQDEGSLSHYEILAELQTTFSEKQIRLMRGVIPKESLSFLDWNKKGTPVHKLKPLIPYLPIGWYIDSMNCLFGAGNWKLKVDLRERFHATMAGSDRQGKCTEVYIEGRLIIYEPLTRETLNSTRIEIISVDCEGGALVRDNATSTLADSFKKARSDATKNACQWIGLGLALKDPVFKQEALDWKAKQ